VGSVLLLAAGDGRQDRRAAGAAVTRDKQINTALKLVAPPPHQRETCRGRIDGMLHLMERAGVAHKVFASDRSKAAISARRAYNSAARRLLAADKALLAAGWRGPIDRAEIERAIMNTEPRPKTWIWVVRSRVANKHRTAVRLAYELLREWNGTIALSRNGTWHKLSALLFGDQRVNLYRHMRAFYNIEIRKR
jgi:hypothetical protein